MSFGDPRFLWLLGLWPLAFLLVLWASRRQERLREKFLSTPMFHRLVSGYSVSRRRQKSFLILLGLAALLLALPRPQIGSELAEVKRRGLDVIVALDTSRSMLAEDLRPNRLQAAKREIEELFRMLRGNRIGLLSFAGESFTNMPLTLDTSAASIFLDGIRVGSIPVPGTNLETAIRRAAAPFPGDERRYKVLVLLTDGEGHEGDALKAAREAEKEGVVIFTIGVGTKEGHTIPLREEQSGILKENLRDRDGRPVFSRLDSGILQKVAALTGGAYYESGGGRLDLEHLRETVLGMETRELGGRESRKPIERMAWFAGLAFLALGFEALLPGKRKEEEKWSGRY